MTAKLYDYQKKVRPVHDDDDDNDENEENIPKLDIIVMMPVLTMTMRLMMQIMNNYDGPLDHKLCNRQRTEADGHDQNVDHSCSQTRRHHIWF